MNTKYKKSKFMINIKSNYKLLKKYHTIFIHLNLLNIFEFFSKKIILALSCEID